LRRFDVEPKDFPDHANRLEESADAANAGNSLVFDEFGGVF
jgi:hypothetical protein